MQRASRGNQTGVAGEKEAAFHIPSLDGLRAVAWAIVFFSHVGPTRFVPGGFGVTIFFFLSGFLITTLMRLEAERTGRVQLRQFYLRRALRILPPMYLALALAVILSLGLGAALSGTALTLQVLHFTNYHVALGGTGRALGTDVLWSLSVEEHFYLAFPLAFIALRRFVAPLERQAAILLGACALLLAWRLVLVGVLHTPPEYTMHATDARVDSILFGCALALYRNPALPGPQVPVAAVWCAFAVGLVVLLLTIVSRDAFFRETLRYSLQGLALAPVFVAAIRFPRSLPFRLLNTRALRWVGVLSYSLYLVHLPIIQVLRLRLRAPEGVLTLLAFAVSISLASAIYYAIEKPCARLRRRLSQLPAS